MNQNFQAWPQRPWFLAGFLAIAGFAFYLVTDNKIPGLDSMQLRVAIAAFVSVSALGFAFSIEQSRKKWALSFAVIWGVILALVGYTSLFSHSGKFDFNFSFLSALLAASIALPLFQTVMKYGRFSLPYKDLHAFAWNDVVCWCASWVFVGLSFLLAHLVAALFDLIGIDLLKKLLREQWFIWVFIGASFGAALGVLKEHDRIVSSLQALVMTILSILAPILCISLGLFLFALPFTGLQAFWNATLNTTPILLGCAAGAIILVNAVIRNSYDEESNKSIMRYSAIGLSFSVLPLAIIAFISMQQRLDQYGLTPERIWGILAVLVAMAYGIGYLWSLLKSRHNWASNLRMNNMRLAIALCFTTLFLSLPIVNFANMSVQSQLARFNKGQIEPEDFDFAAFAFDFGEHGRQVLTEMKSSEDPQLANGAKAALLAESKWQLQREIREQKSSALSVSKLVVYPKQVTLPETLQQKINKNAGCLGEYCLVVWEQGSQVAKFITSKCHYYLPGDPYNRQHGYQKCPPTVTVFKEFDGVWKQANSRYFQSTKASDDAEKNQEKKIIANAIEQDRVEIRTVERQQIYIGGKPVGDPY